MEDAAGASSALKAAGFSVDAERVAVVLEVGGEDRPGVLGRLSRAAADAGVNLVACYVATGSRLVFVADDADGLRSALDAASG